MQFQVPQFIDTEDKIVGPLSMRQFATLVVAAGISTVLYFSVSTWLWVILSIPLLALGAAMAFIKINGRPFSKLLFAGFSFYWKPQTYVWQPDQPRRPKTPETVRESLGSTLSVEKFFSGMALKKVWGAVQTGSPAKEEPAKPRLGPEHYEIFRNISGENRAAKRVDYR